MSLTKATYSMIDSTTVNVLDFVPPAEKALISAGTPSISVTSYIQAAHISLPQLGGNYQGTLYFPAGKYRLDTGLNISATVLTNGYGAVLDYSNASATVVAITCNSVSTGSQFDLTFGGIRGLTILGPGRANTGSKGILYGDPTAGSLICHEKSFQDLVISEFGKGIDQGNNAYNCKWINCFIYRCNHGAYFATGLANSAEIVEFHGCVLAECVASNMSSIANSQDIAYFGGSIDYPLGSGGGGTGVNLNGDTIATFYGTHFEATAGDIMVRNSGPVGNPTVNFYGCTFTIATGGAATPFIDANYIHCTLVGGWVRVAAGTQTNFLESADIYSLLGQQLIVYGTVTNVFYTGASVSGNKSIDNQVFTPKTIVSEYKALTMFGLGTNFGLYFRTAAGAPANSLAGIEKGSILLNQADTKLYINTGTSSSTTWTVVGTQT